MSRRHIARCHEPPYDISFTTYRYDMLRSICRGQCERGLREMFADCYLLEKCLLLTVREIFTENCLLLSLTEMITES